MVGLDHPMHLHGFSFFVVGWGFGNFDPIKDPLRYNIADPQKRNTVIVPKNGWVAIRFTADNPGIQVISNVPKLNFDFNFICYSLIL